MLKNVYKYWLILVGICVTLIWFLEFPLSPRNEIDTVDVFIEGFYLLAAIVGYLIVSKIGVEILKHGWGIFVVGLLIDWYDEFTVESYLINTVIEGIITSAGLLLVSYGLYITLLKERKLMKKIKESENKYRSLFENSPDLMAIINYKGNIIEINNNFEKYFNVPRKNVLGKSIYEFFPRDVAEKFLKEIKNVIDKRTKISFENSINGRYFHNTLIPLEINHKLLCYMILRDITSRKRIEEKLKESEELFRTLAEGSLVGVYLIQDNKIVYVNPALADIFGYKVEEMINRSPLEFIHPDDRETVVKNIEKRIKGEVRSIRYILRGIRKDKKIIYCEVLGQKIDYKGKPAIIGTLIDITERIKKEEEIKKINEQLKLLNSLLRHDLQNDLAIIKGYLDIYKDFKNEEILKKIEKRISIALERIKEIKEIEKTVTTKSMLKPVNVHEILKKEIESITTNRIKVNLNVPKNLYVMADEMLYSVFSNILLNAVLHNDKNEIKIDISSKELNGYVEIRIADNGPGIPDELKEKIFEERFKYGKTGRTGLGLYFVKEAMKRYKGAVWVEDNKPSGSIFVLKFRKSGKSDEKDENRKNKQSSYGDT